MSIDTGYQLFKTLPTSSLRKIERSVYNRRKRKIFPNTEQIRKKLSNAFAEFEDYFIVDSIPLEVWSANYSGVLIQKFVKKTPW